MSQTERISHYVDTEGDDRDAINLGLSWLVALGEQHEGTLEAVLAIPTKRVLDGVISDIIGEQATRALQNKEPVSLDGVKIHLMTTRIGPAGSRDGVILAAFPDRNLLDKIDGIYGTKAVLAIPSTLNSIDFWINRWGASALRSDSDGEALDIGDPIAKEAFEDLHFCVNESSGITDPRDRSTCIEVLKTLHNEGVQFNPEAIEAWLIREKAWKPRHATEVREVAEGVLNGKRFQYRKGGLANDIFNQWKEQAREN